MKIVAITLVVFNACLHKHHIFGENRLKTLGNFDKNSIQTQGFL